MPAGGPSDSSIQEEEEEGPLFKCFFISYSNHEELQWPFFGELVMESLDLIQHEKVPWTKYIKPSALPGKFPTSLSYIWVEAVPVSDLRHCNGWCVNSMSVVQISWYRWCPADNILQWDWAIWIISMSSTQKKMTSNRNPVDQHFMEYQWGTRTWIFRHILDLQLSISCCNPTHDRGRRISICCKYGDSSLGFDLLSLQYKMTCWRWRIN